jgi:DNA invertase Pin-like site-specific DNA recombinase
MKEKFVAYYRVSTEKQGINGLGIEAQKAAVRNFLKAGERNLLAQFQEVESGTRNDRPELQKALQLCRKTKAKLLIAKLDRLARSASFLFSLRDSGMDFICCDMPEADRFTVGLFALLAEKERDLISERTKAGLAAAKERGIKLGNPQARKALKLAWSARTKACQLRRASLAPVVREIQKTGMTGLAQIAECLNRRGYKTPMGRSFTKHTVCNLLKHITV